MAGKKLLVADDSLTIQKVIRLALSNEGYEIQTVSDGDDAVQQISLFRPDIVLIDVSLPGQTAFDVKRAINAHEDLKGVRFVLMSSAFERIDEKQLATLVFDGRLTKPFDPAHLRQVLSGVLSKGPSHSGGTALTPTAPIPTALVTPPPSPPQSSSYAIPPRPSAGPQAPAPAPPPPPQAPAAAMPDFVPPEAPPEDFNSPEQPDEPPPGLIAEEDNYGPKYIPTPPSPQEEVTQPFLNPFQSPRQPSSPTATPRSDSLWDDHDTRFDAPPPPPPPPPAPPPRAAAPRQAPPPATMSAPGPGPAPEGGDDIRHLTESTIRMSGLDDFEWSVSEPSLKPHSAFADEGDGNFPMGDEAAPPEPPVPDSNEFADEEEATEFISTPAPPPGLPPITSGSFTPPPPPGKVNAGRSAKPATVPAAPAPEPMQTFRPEPPRAAPPAATPTIDSSEIERIVRHQVQETLEKLAQRILPEVAEKVIKQEIHRMLSELP